MSNPREFAERMVKNAPLALAAAALLMVAQPAAAQNLVVNPSFAAGGGSFTGYTTNAQSFGYFNGTYAANLTAGSFLTQTIATTPNATYLVSFLATFGGQTTANFTASFGSQSLNYTNATGCCSFAPFSFTTTATGTATDLTFTAGPGGSEFVTGLDVEAAPAPIPGAGLPALLVALGGLSIAALRQRRNRLANAA